MICLVPRAALEDPEFPQRDARRAFIAVCREAAYPLLEATSFDASQQQRLALLFGRPAEELRLLWLDEPYILMGFVRVAGALPPELEQMVRTAVPLLEESDVVRAFDAASTPERRERAVYAAGLLVPPPGSAELEARLIAALGDPDASVRHGALTALQYRPQPSYWPVLEALRADLDPELRERVTRLLEGRLARALAARTPAATD